MRRQNYRLWGASYLVKTITESNSRSVIGVHATKSHAVVSPYKDRLGHDTMSSTSGLSAVLVARSLTPLTLPPFRLVLRPFSLSVTDA